MNRREALKAFAVTPVALQQTARAWVLPVVCGVLVIGVGVWIGYEIYQMCKKVDQQKPVDEDDPQQPPQNKANFMPPTQQQPNAQLKLSDASGVLYYDATPYNLVDCNGELVSAIMQTRLQSSTDLRSWGDEVKLTGWCAPSGMTVMFSRAGVVIGTCYLSQNATEFFNLPGPWIVEAQKFYRLAAP